MVGASVCNGTAEGVDMFQLALLIAAGRPFQRIQINRIGDAKILERAQELSINGFRQTDLRRNAVVEVWKNALAVHTLRGSRQAQQDARLIIGQELLIGRSRRVVELVHDDDIYNEGVDIPEVNTVLFLRPTESLTIFLQQLGRGLRLAEDKECLTVLDFIGQANRRYNFEDKFAALLSNATRSVSREIKDGFVSVPKGCYIQLEKKAAKYILENIRASYGNTAGLVARAASFAEDSGLELTLKNFLDHYHLDPRAI